MQDALQDLQNEFGEIAASFAVSCGPWWSSNGRRVSHLLHVALHSGGIHNVNHSVTQEHVPQYAMPALQAETSRCKQTSGGPTHMDYQ